LLGDHQKQQNSEPVTNTLPLQYTLFGRDISHNLITLLIAFTRLFTQHFRWQFELGAPLPPPPRGVGGGQLKTEARAPMLRD
jgi:hypothetical protein